VHDWPSMNWPPVPQTSAMVPSGEHCVAPGAQMPSHAPLFTHVELTQGEGVPATPVAPHNTSEFPVQVFEPGMQLPVQPMALTHASPCGPCRLQLTVLGFPVELQSVSIWPLHVMPGVQEPVQPTPLTQAWFTHVVVVATPVALQLVSTWPLQAMPGAQLPAHPPLTTQAELTQGVAAPGTPPDPHATSELPVQVLVLGAHVPTQP
jgi:hypothetical protein